MALEFSTKTPIKLQGQILSAFVKAYKQLIEDHGASYAVNFALGSHLESIGFAPGKLETRAERIARSQHKRWKSVKAEIREQEGIIEARREAKRERDRRYRAKRKASKTSEPSTPEE